MPLNRLPSRAICLSRLEQGFTLAELAIVVIIIGFLLGGLLMPLSVQMDLRRTADTKKTMDEVKEALIGFAMANGRLPCPATAASNGVEAPSGGGVCTSALAGFVPAVTLSLTPVDTQGYLLDGWNNRLRYAVTTANTSAFTTAGQMKAVTISVLASDLRVCSTSTGMTTGASAVCAPTAVLTSSAVAVVYSLGPNFATGGTAADESKNLDNDRAFISHDPTPTGATNGEFDDFVVWISSNVLYSRLVAAGALP